MRVLYVLDSGAVVRLTEGHVRLARLLYDASVFAHTVIAPVTCLLEAAAAIAATGRSRVTLLTALRAPVIRVTPAHESPSCLVNAAQETKAYRCRLLTTRPAEATALGLAAWQVVAL